MKILKIVANNFKLCEDNFTISFVPEANKTHDDKEFELHEIDDNLFVFTTMSIIGKNASGKTSVTDLLALVYDIFSFFRVRSMAKLFMLWNKIINLDITFYHEGYLYRYITDLVPSTDSINQTIIFKNEKLFRRVYYKSYSKNLFDYDKYEEMHINFDLPEDTSMLYGILNKIKIRGVYFDSDENNFGDYSLTFDFYKAIDNGDKLTELILKILDEHLDNIKMIGENKYIMYYANKETKEVSGMELYHILSSGTTKGFNLFTLVLHSLITGSDLIVDEIENHFHKTLVQYLVNLFKDKSVNKKNATLIFTTHYCELLDLFNRSDNIYITKYDNKIKLENVYRDYNFRPELSKSKKFYNNAFDTGVNYESLMNFKKELM